MELYVAFQNGQPSPLDDLAVQYIDVVAWQQASLQGEPFEKQLAYWKEQLGGTLPVLDLPADHPRPALQTYRGAHLPFQFPVALTADLNALSQREDVTIFMLLLAAFQVHCASLSWSGRYTHWHSHRQSQKNRDGKAHRVFYQYPGYPHGPVRASDVSRAFAAGARKNACRL